MIIPGRSGECVGGWKKGSSVKPSMCVRSNAVLEKQNRPADGPGREMMNRIRAHMRKKGSYTCACENGEKENKENGKKDKMTIY